MNVKELVEALKKYPDDMMVFVESSAGEYSPHVLKHVRQSLESECFVERDMKLPYPWVVTLFS